MKNRLKQLFENDSRSLLLLFIATFYLIPTKTYAGEIVGAVTAVKKNVYVTHPEKDKRLLVQKGDDVLFSDTYETETGAKAKLLFSDDSLITLGENSRLRISENIYKPEKKQRSVVMDLLSGSARALVSKTFSGAKSKFEIHTPTAVAAAKGTYFIVRFYEEERLSEIFNLSRSSIIEVSPKDPTQRGIIKIMPHQMAGIKRGEPMTILSKGDKEFSKKLSQALSDTEFKEMLSERNAGFQALTSAQIAKFEFDSDLPSDDCRQATLSSSSKSSESRLLGECDDDQNIPHQLPPGIICCAGLSGNSPVTLEINFR